MKKIIIFGLLLISLIINRASADNADNLKKRLDKITSFHANFTQKVVDSNGNTIQEGQGDLWMKRPNLFNWHMIHPDESFLVSDGKTLWFYNPLIEQVIITCLKNTTNNTPFMLIADNQIHNWQQYSIKQIGDNFKLTPKDTNNNLKEFSISVSSNGIINQFSAVDQNGQCSNYQLNSQQNCTIDASKFSFKLPQGVTLDDQRNKNN